MSTYQSSSPRDSSQARTSRTKYNADRTVLDTRYERWVLTQTCCPQICWTDWLRVMSPAEAMLLTVLRNHFPGDDKQFWVACSVDSLDQACHGSIPKSAQARLIKSLINRGFLGTRRIGMPGQRHVHVYTALIFLAVYESVLAEGKR